MSSRNPPALRTGPTGPTTTVPKPMAERVGDIKGRMTSGPSIGPVINRPVTPRTDPSMPTGPVINRPVTPRTEPTRPSMPTGPVINRPMPRPAGMKSGGKVSDKAEAKYSSGGSTGKASSRADGIAQRGKTKGRIC